MGVRRFEHFSRYNTLLRAVARLIHIASTFSRSTQDSGCQGWHICKKSRSQEDLEKAKIIVLKCTQQDAYSEEIKNINAGHPLASKSPLHKLHPCVDANGLLRSVVALCSQS
ncbi:hypothetical protein DPEC_G00266420 [Dallia pectoralis]|uniref:Uncharacterized protein n=1 Tax=Dallia pectoralis TaxID=75939 RepID=A0ACC2FN33_DALPE|nr:hypothetical protein DPEC_G00266420 [Dallia pectoralis]